MRYVAFHWCSANSNSRNLFIVVEAMSDFIGAASSSQLNAREQPHVPNVNYTQRAYVLWLASVHPSRLLPLPLLYARVVVDTQRRVSKTVRGLVQVVSCASVLIRIDI